MAYMTSTKRIAYRMFGQTVILLVFYGALSLLAATKFLPQDLLFSAMNYAHASAFANVALHLAIVTGLLAGGIYVVSNERQSQAFENEDMLTVTAFLWMLFLIVSFFAGFFNQLEGRQGLELPTMLDFAEVVLLVIFVVSVFTGAESKTPFVTVWAIGMAVCAVCVVIGVFPAGDMVTDRILRTLAIGLSLNVGYVLAGVALAFWLMTRFSDASQMWADSSLYTVAGLLAIAGVWISIGPLASLGATFSFGIAPLVVVPVFCFMFASHSYRALSDRNPTMTLAAHWTALGVILLLCGIGFLGAAGSVPAIQQYIQGTRLTDLQATFTALGVVAFVLGTFNQASAEIRGRNERITGLMPFWLVCFGTLIGGAALLTAGVAQVYMERWLSVGYLDVQQAIVPLYMLWILGTLAVAAGIGIYALGFRARRPVISSS